jgi:ketosteroid isomerase-like protein
VKTLDARRLFLSGVLTIGVVVAGAGCDAGRSGGGVPEDLLAEIESFYAAVEAGDTERRIRMFSPGAILMPNHWPMIAGGEAVAEGLRGSGDMLFRIRDREIVDMDASGDIAYTINSYSYTYHKKDADPVWHKTKNVHIWKRIDGRWKLHVDIWNSDEPESGG